MSCYFYLLLTVFLYMNVWFVVSVIKKRNDVADIAWGLGFVLTAWTSLLISCGLSFKPLLVNLLVTLWGLRLSTHIFKRSQDKSEDYRYKEWREKWGKYFYIRSYLQVFILQGVFLYLIILPVIFINLNGRGFTFFDVVGLLTWFIGFYFEVVGDRQLKNFVIKPENKGKIMQEGLWKYSRHPNYFGEVTMWWGIFIIAAFEPGGWITIIGPLTITILILFVSGIPLLEKKYTGNQEFEDYKRRTSIFIPLPPGKRV